MLHYHMNCNDMKQTYQSTQLAIMEKPGNKEVLWNARNNSTVDLLQRPVCPFGPASTTWSLSKADLEAEFLGRSVVKSWKQLEKFQNWSTRNFFCADKFQLASGSASVTPIQGCITPDKVVGGGWTLGSKQNWDSALGMMACTSSSHITRVLIGYGGK